jgi:hypothetical protein
MEIEICLSEIETKYVVGQIEHIKPRKWWQFWKK